MKNKKLLVIGAGASIGAKRYPIESSLDEVANRMPSADNFFYDLFKTNKTDNRPASSLNFLGLTYENLNDLITRSWNINESSFDPEEWKNVNIEEVMTFFEIGSKMYPKNSGYQKVFKKAQKYLLDFIHPLLTIRSDGQHCEYLMNVMISLKSNDSIISFNWDTIAEQTLQRINAIQLKNYAKLLREKNINIDYFRNRGVLLKLHGSLNWFSCNNPKCKEFNKIKPPFQDKRYQLLKINQLWECKSCGNKRLEHIIIPPVSEKMIYRKSFLKKQWLIARNLLIDTTELIFIGYSFPPTDYYSEWLFRQLNFVEGKKKPKIIIVNPDYKKRNSLVWKRYNTIFRDYEIEHHNTLKEYSKIL